MADYLRDTQSRSNMPHKNVLMVSYTHMKLDESIDVESDDFKSKMNTLKNLSKSASAKIHKSVEFDSQIRDGSIIIELSAMGLLNESLSIENLTELGIIRSPSEAVELMVEKGQKYLEHRLLRRVLVILVKELKAATAALSQNTQWVFKAKRANLLRSESRTGVVGSLLRGLEAIDVVRSTGIPMKRRVNAMKDASKLFDKVNESTDNTDDRAWLCGLLSIEMRRIPDEPEYRIYRDKVVDVQNLLCGSA